MKNIDLTNALFKWVACSINLMGCDGSSIKETRPEESRFTKIELASNLNEPMELAVLPNGNILLIERKGAVKLYDRSAKSITTIATLPVFHELEDGLLGLTLDPDYTATHWLYLFYSPIGTREVQRIARFDFNHEQLDFASEKILLEIPVQRKECCHSAGSLTFGPDKTLFIAVGDNTNPHNPGYYNSIDERIGREFWDAQRTAANTNDLRGKILRINPTADGTYSIPDGNLFPKEGSMGKPEIYAMGCRNPYRISVDQKTGYLYWGDVGQNTEDNPARGPISYDEFNQAKAPGFFGWPYFAGNNQPYTDFDFETNVNGYFFDQLKPINNSRNNTGNKILPPAQNAFIWYTYEEDTTRFRNLGSGGKSPIIGPVYYPPNAQPTWSSSTPAFPKYYEGKLFIAEWMRDWINVVTMDESGNHQSIDRFMPSTTFDHPIDLEFGPDGSLYVLEYGTFWFSANTNARLSVIEFNAGNRSPVAILESNKVAGALPLTVDFSAAKSFDYDSMDALSFEWLVEGKKISGQKITHQFVEPGKHLVQLTVLDNHGSKNSRSISITSGNAYPKIDIRGLGNQTFFWPGKPIRYTISVVDSEDGSLNQGIKNDEVVATLDAIDVGSGEGLIKTSSMSEAGDRIVSNGLKLMDASDCKACHHAEVKSVGPSYKKIAGRYPKGGQEEIALLGTKIINGGNGNWGEVAMSAHPQMSRADAEEIVTYILTEYSSSKKFNRIALTGTVTPDKKLEKDYLFTAVYTDKGVGKAPPLSATQYFLLRWPTIQPASYNESKFTSKLNDGVIRFAKPGSYLMFNDIDVTDLSEVTYTLAAPAAGSLELRIDSPDGPLISEAFLDTTKVQLPSMPLAKSKVIGAAGLHNIYVVYKNIAPRPGTRELLDLVRIGFN